MSKNPRPGQGPYVVCLHSSTGSGKQWQALTKSLAEHFTVIAPDLYGYGEGPDWPEDRVLELDDEVNRICPIIERLICPVHLVGHSYGAAVAIKLALTMPTKVRSLTAYEPVLFNLLFHDDDLDAASEIWMVSDDVHWLLVDGRYSTAAERFIDYWSGEGTWARFPDWRRAAIEKRMKKVRADFDAVMGNPTPLTAYRDLRVPTLFLYGLQSPQSTRKIAEWVGRELPHAEVRGLLPMGHMGPVTHADEVNRMIVSFLRRQPNGILSHQLRTVTR